MSLVTTPLKIISTHKYLVPTLAIKGGKETLLYRALCKLNESPSNSSALISIYVNPSGGVAGYQIVQDEESFTIVEQKDGSMFFNLSLKDADRIDRFNHFVGEAPFLRNDEVILKSLRIIDSIGGERNYDSLPKTQRLKLDRIASKYFNWLKDESGELSNQILNYFKSIAEQN